MTEEERFLRRCADELEAAEKSRREAPRMVDLRKWVIERLLLMPGADALLRPGWVHEAADVVECDGPGGLTVLPPKLTRTPPCIFAIADDLVRYAATGEHPKAEEPGP
jgi:hypothetical protein